jgi:hypothetical protein
LVAGAGARRWPTDAEFRTALQSQPQYGKKSTRHLLVTLEEYWHHKEQVDLAAATIEHVLPQTLTHAWRLELGANADRIRAELADTLGNLTLTAYNSELANLPFAEKKARLATSHIELNRWICEQPQWTDAEIKTRADLLVDSALQIWPRPLGTEVA